MAIRRRSRSLGTIIGGAMAVDISHASDSIKLGDGTDLVALQDVSGVKSLPVKVQNTVTVTETATADGTARTKITDGTNNAGLTLVGGNYALKVDVVQTTGGGAGGTSQTDSAAFTAGSTAFTPIGGYLDDTASDALAEGEGGIVRMTSARAMHVYVAGQAAGASGLTDAELRATAVPVSAASLPLPSGASTEATLASIKTSSELIDDMIATIAAAVPTKAAFVAGTDGTNARALKTDASGELQIDVLTLPALVAGTANIGDVDIASIAAGDNNIGNVDVVTLPALPAGTNNIGDVDIASIAAGDNNIGNVDVLTMPAVAGAAAHDAAVSGNPVRVAGRAMLANGTAVAEDDTADIATDNQGRVVVTPHVPRDLIVHGNATLTTTTETTLVAAGAAGIFHDITKLVLTNSSATATRVAVKDSTTGTTRIEVALAANGGAVIDFGSVPMCQATAANNWTVTLSGAVTSIYCYGQAIKRIA